MQIGVGQELSFPGKKCQQGSGEGIGVAACPGTAQCVHTYVHGCAPTGRAILGAMARGAVVPAPALCSAPGMHSSMHSGMQTLLTWRSGRNHRVLLIPSCRAARSAANSLPCLEGCPPPPPSKCHPGPLHARSLAGLPAPLHTPGWPHAPVSLQLPSCLPARRDYTAAPAAIWRGEPAPHTQGTVAHVTGRMAGLGGTD